jgi:hypothetical protein
MQVATVDRMGLRVVFSMNVPSRSGFASLSIFASGYVPRQNPPNDQATIAQA